MFFRFVSALVLLPCSIGAATANWAAVEALTTSDRVRITLSNGKTLNGNVDHVTADALFVSKRGRTTEARREDILRVSRKRGSGMKWALIGAAIGAGAGGAAGGAVLEREPGLAGAMAGAVVLCAGIGAGVGYLAGHGRWILIYESANPINERSQTH